MALRALPRLVRLSAPSSNMVTVQLRRLSHDSLVPVAAAGTAAPSQSYTITESPIAAATTRPKWGRYVLRNIPGHTKKLNPITRQVCAKTWPIGRVATRQRCIAAQCCHVHSPILRFQLASRHTTNILVRTTLHLLQLVGLSVNEALAQMSFLAKRRGRAVGTAIERAAWNADYHHDIRREDLLVDEAWTGKQLTQGRIRYHSKGRAGRSHMRTSTVTVKLREMTSDERNGRQKFPWRATELTRAKLDPRGY